MAKSVLHTIEDNLSTFSKGQKRIGRYILDHYDQAAFMTASKLGKLTEVSESTVVRFAAELGFDGYPAMQKALQEMARNRLTSTQRIQAAENIYDRDVLSSVLQADIENLRQVALNEDRRTFDTAVNRIVGARHIYILGARSSTHLAGYLHFYMQMIFENVTLVQSTAAGEIFEQLFRCGEGDVMIALSFPRYSKDTINAVRFAKSRGVEIVAITDQEQSPVAQMSAAALRQGRNHEKPRRFFRVSPHCLLFIFHACPDAVHVPDAPGLSGDLADRCAGICHLAQRQESSSVRRHGAFAHGGACRACQSGFQSRRRNDFDVSSLRKPADAGVHALRCGRCRDAGIGRALVFQLQRGHNLG